MTATGPSRQPHRPDSELYPEVAAAGSLAAALSQCAAKHALDLGDVRSSSDGSSLTFAWVASRNPQLGGFSVNLGSVERVFIVSAGGRGVTLTHGSTDDLEQVAAAAAAWHDGVGLVELQATTPFLEVGALALAHERGPEYAVAEKWRVYLEEDPYVDLEMMRAANAEPRLRALFPYTSHRALGFSRCTGWPFSRDMAAIEPLGDGRYALRHHAEEFRAAPNYTAQEAAALVVSRMAKTWGQAVAGTEHDLREGD
ncbi:DUF6193 family natural product biosynthesis protein [Streptomyces sp. NPDC087270]|uniref:DUF6193 family natural product biosynthesis protein n=1 Tax=Streptomyces sp. NPDC087270 TaxID=3365774 RepID=UPI0038034F32